MARVCSVNGCMTMCERFHYLCIPHELDGYEDFIPPPTDVGIPVIGRARRGRPPKETTRDRFRHIERTRLSQGYSRGCAKYKHGRDCHEGCACSCHMAAA